MENAALIRDVLSGVGGRFGGIGGINELPNPDDPGGGGGGFPGGFEIPFEFPQELPIGPDFTRQIESILDVKVGALRVELMVPTAQFGTLAPGDRVTIRSELPGVDAVTATVRHVDRVLDADSNSFRVRLTLPNPNYRLPAGLRCKADLPGSPAVAMPAASATAPKMAPAVGQRSPAPGRAPL